MNSTALGYCKAEAIDAAKAHAAKSWKISKSNLKATVDEDNFNQTFGRGEYIVSVESVRGENHQMVLIMDMIAYTNEDDTKVSCEVQEIITY